MEELGRHAVTLRIEGTLEGDVGSVLLAFDPSREAVLVSGSFDGEDFTFTMVGHAFSADGTDGGFQWRDHDPQLDIEAFVEEFFGDDLDVDFDDDLAFSDYDYACKTLGERTVIEYAYDDGEVQDTLVLEREAPHRPLSGRAVDPVLQDDFRISFSHDRPDIQVDSEQPRMPLELYFVEEDYAEDSDGWFVLLTFDEDAEWAPLDEFTLDVLGADDYDYGQLYNEYILEHGLFQLDEGYYEFNDADGNGLLSAGDSLEVGLAWGYTFDLWDDWAGDYVELGYV